MPSRLLQVGDIFANKAIRQGAVLTQDYVAAEPDTKVLCINGFDYFIAYDKYLQNEVQAITKCLKKMKALEKWNHNKFDTMS